MHNPDFDRIYTPEEVAFLVHSIEVAEALFTAFDVTTLFKTMVPDEEQSLRNVQEVLESRGEEGEQDNFAVFLSVVNAMLVESRSLDVDYAQLAEENRKVFNIQPAEVSAADLPAVLAEPLQVFIAVASFFPDYRDHFDDEGGDVLDDGLNVS